MSNAWQKYKESLSVAAEPIDIDALIAANEKTDEETSKTRFSICSSCPDLIKDTTQCTHCGCFMKSRVEFKMATCPLGKW